MIVGWWTSGLVGWWAGGLVGWWAAGYRLSSFLWPLTGIYQPLRHYRRAPRFFASLSILVICQVFFLKKFIVFS